MSRPETGEDTATAAPFLKWAGGKSGLLAQYEPYFPPRERVQRYIEPFVGGGAVFFHLQYHPSRLADVNPELIEVYRVVQQEVEALIDALAAHVNEADHFYAVRATDPATLDPVQRAARFIYLNRTCYNGLYRVNRKGRFNVPFGRYANPTICDSAGLRAASRALEGVELRVASFDESTADCGEGDFVYFDPPYVPVSATARFTDYAKDGFGEAEQRRLADVFRKLDRRGCLLMLSNSDANLVRELYQGEENFPFREVQARRVINSDPSKRGPVCELVITNYPVPRNA